VGFVFYFEMVLCEIAVMNM